MSKKKLVIFGIDGGTWKVLKPLIDAGKLPNIKNIMEGGVYGDLSSTFPPLTIPAWLSMATGKNPGNFGVFSFVKKNEKDFSGKLVTSKDFKKNNTYWDLLNTYGYRTFLINHPMLYPYYDINGVMIGGMGLPAYAKKTHPDYLEKELHDITGGYKTHITHSLKNKDILILELNDLLEKQFIAVDYLLKKDWNLFLHVSSVSDWLQHSMWEDWIDTTSNYHQDFINIFKKLDKKLGSILPKISDTNIIIISDHGFGSLKENFNLSKWLYMNGYMKKIYFASIRKGIRSIMHILYKKIKNKPIGRYFKFSKFSSGIWQKQLNIGLPVPPEININKSVVIPGHTAGYKGSLYIKESTKNYETLKKEIINELNTTAKKYNFNIEILKREDLYHGKKMNLAPDIIFKINNFRCNIQISTLKGKIFSNDISYKNMSGVHRTEGIFMAYGPDIAIGRTIQGVTIYDIAPTILHIFGVPIPKDVDGKVLKDIFRKDSKLGKADIKYKKSNNEEMVLKKRIHDLKVSEKI